LINLFIADDEAIIRQGLLSIDWRSIGVRVVGDVSNGFEAVDLLQSEIIDVALVDIRMPGFDGIELSKFVFEHEMCTRVILLSGYKDFEYAQSAIRYNVSQYILKPSSPEELLEAVKNASQQAEKRRQNDMRLRLLEAELGKRQLIMDDNDIVLGEFDRTFITQRILNYIADNYKKPVSLSSMSKELYYSTVYLSKVIKKDTGYTFLEILNAVRVHSAAERLREDNQNLAIVGESVCINDPRYFSHVFKKYFGISPAIYRKTPCEPVDLKLIYLVKTIKKKK